MNPKVKLGAYAVLLILAVWFGWGFHSNYGKVAKEEAVAATNDTTAANPTTPTTTTTTNATPDASNTNATNAAAPTASAPAAPQHTEEGRSQGAMIAYLAALIAVLIGLGLLITMDVTQLLGSAAVDALLDDRGEGMRDPEYEKAEQSWANGQFLEAIQMMREFLKRNPREQYAALRIAEIYEKDLNNFLAAALEYEEVLKKKLPAERWGWAAIHLCNLYSKLNQQDKTRALLQRIADKYPKTGAAKKARNRLGIPEPEPDLSEVNAEAHAAEDTGEDLGAETEEKPTAPEPPKPAEPEPKSNLPPGFRAKK